MLLWVVKLWYRLLFLLDRGYISTVLQSPARSKPTARQGLPMELISGTGRHHGWQIDSSSIKNMMPKTVWLRSLKTGEHAEHT